MIREINSNIKRTDSSNVVAIHPSNKKVPFETGKTYRLKDVREYLGDKYTLNMNVLLEI